MLILDILAILVAAAAIFLAWRASQDLKSLTGKLDRMQTVLYETRQEQRKSQEQVESRIAGLDVSVQKATGKLRFNPDASLTHLYEIEPRAEDILAAFHIGGCAECMVDENHSLAEAVRERGADLDRVLTALNTLPPDGSKIDLRVPNVQTNF